MASHIRTSLISYSLVGHSRVKHGSFWSVHGFRAPECSLRQVAVEVVGSSVVRGVLAISFILRSVLVGVDLARGFGVVVAVEAHRRLSVPWLGFSEFLVLVTVGSHCEIKIW